MPNRFEQAVRERAKDRCEYCHVPRIAYDTPFQVDHIIAKQHGGASAVSNFAYACYHCNLNKGPNIASLDPPATGELVRLFNPRMDDWAQHVEWEQGILIGRTAIGRATILVLNMNDPPAAAVPELLILEGFNFA